MKGDMRLHPIKITTVVSFFFAACATQEKPDFLTFNFDQTANLVLEAANSQADYNIFGWHDTFLPMGIRYTDTLAVRAPGEYVLTYRVNRPGVVYLQVGEQVEIPLFVVPDDTLRLKLDLSDVSRLMDAMQLQGRTAHISRYQMRKHQVESEFNSRKAQLRASNLSLSQYAAAMDSLLRKELKLLGDFSNFQRLPEWFVEHEKTELFYATARAKLVTPVYRRQILQRQEAVPEGYFDFLAELAVDNASGVLAPSYYLFLDSYFSNLVEPDEAEALDLEERIRLVSTRKLSLADSLLSGEVRDIFKSMYIALYAISQDRLSLADALIQQHKDRFSNKKYFDFLQHYRATKYVLQPGAPAPDFRLPDENGEFHALSEFRGKVVLLNFWFVGCAPSLRELPHEREVIENLREENFVMINICTNSSRENWLRALQEQQLGGVHLFAEANQQKELERAYAIVGYPHYTLIDRAGKVSQNRTRRPSEGLEEDIRKLINGFDSKQREGER